MNCICPGITDATGVWKSVSAGYIENLQLPREEVVQKFTAKIPLERLTSPPYCGLVGLMYVFNMVRVHQGPSLSG